MSRRRDLSNGDGSASEDAAGFDAVRALLRPRIFHRRELAGPRRAMCRREAFGGLLKAVALGPGPSAPLVTTQVLDTWPVTFEQALQIAGDNLRSLIGPDDLDAVEGAAGVVALTARSRRTGLEQPAAASLILDRMFPRRGAPNGVVFSLPSEEVLLALPVREAAGVEGLAILVQLTMSLVQENEEPLSEQLFWWRSGSAVPILFTQVEDQRSTRVHLEAHGPNHDLLLILGAID